MGVPAPVRCVALCAKRYGDRLGIVPLETFHDGAKRLADPPHERGVDEKKKNQGKGKKRKDEPLARAVEFLDHRRLVADDKLGEWGSVPTGKHSREYDSAILFVVSNFFDALSGWNKMESCV